MEFSSQTILVGSSYRHDNIQNLPEIRNVLSIAPMRVRRVAYLTQCRPILEYVNEVWHPQLVCQITSFQRKAIRFISGIRGREGVTEARTFLKIELLELRHKNARMSLMLKFLAGNSYTFYTDNFNHLQNIIHSHETLLVKSGAPLAVPANSGFYTHSFLPRPSRNLQGFP